MEGEEEGQEGGEEAGVAEGLERPSAPGLLNRERVFFSSKGMRAFTWFDFWRWETSGPLRQRKQVCWWAPHRRASVDLATE